MKQDTPATDSTSKEQRGFYLIPQLRTDSNPMLFGSSSAPTDLDPQDKCKCGNWNVDCICEPGE